MKKQIILFTALALAVCTAARAQRVTDVYLDCFTGEVSYFSKGEKCAKPVFPKNRQIVLHLTELNPHLFEAKVSTEARNNAAAGLQAAGFAGLVSGFLPGSFGKILGAGLAAPDTASRQSAGGGFSLFDIPLLKVNDRTLSLKSFFGGSRGAAEQVAQATQAMRDVEASVEEFRKNYAALKEMEGSVAAAGLAFVNFETIKTNPSLRPSLIRKFTEEYYQKIFANPVPGEFSVGDLMRWQNMPTEFVGTLARLRDERTEFVRRKNALAAIGGQLLQLDAGDDAAFEAFSKDVREVQATAATVEKQWATTLEQGEQMMQKKWLPDLQTISNLQLDMIATMQAPPEIRQEIALDGDEIAVQVDILKKARPTDSTAAQPLKTHRFSLRTSGGMSLRMGTGLQLSSYFDAPQHFHAREGVLAAEDGSVVVPAVMSSLQIFRNTAGSVAPTLGVGIGLPVLSDEKGILFFLAPGITFGRSRQLTWLAGVAFGQVSRLGRGFEVGDAFDVASGDIPLQKRFEPAWFTGLSFNFSSVGK